MLLDVERPREVRGLYGRVVIPPTPDSPELQASKVLAAVHQLLPVAHRHLVAKRHQAARRRLRAISIEVEALRTELAGGEVSAPAASLSGAKLASLIILATLAYVAALVVAGRALALGVGFGVAP